jgi:hypothetical protein
LLAVGCRADLQAFMDADIGHANIARPRADVLIRRSAK